MDDLIQQGINVYKSGDRENARKLLIAAVKQFPDDERSWGWLYNVCNSDRERIQCLKQVLRINPQNEKARLLLIKLTEVNHPIKLQVNKNEKNNILSLGLLWCGGAVLVVIIAIVIIRGTMQTSVPAQVQAVVSPAQVLQSHGFVRDPSNDANCPTTCKVYTYLQLDMTAIVYDNGAFGISLNPQNTSEANASGELLGTVISSIYDKNVATWIEYNMTDLANTNAAGSQTGIVDSYKTTITLTMIPGDIGPVLMIIINPE